MMPLRSLLTSLGLTAVVAGSLAFLASLRAEDPRASSSPNPAPAHPLDEPVQRPAVPATPSSEWPLNPIDAFIGAEHARRGLQPRPEAPRELLMRRVYLDLIGLNPTPDEQRAFAEDLSPGAYERLVDRLLQDPRYGERWARHWMDVWRYSDWAGWSGGNQIRDSKPHIWRWRDWIVDSLNQDKGYDRMVVEMLAADECAPDDPQALRATGYLVRNYKMLSREQWLEDTVKHTAQAFLGVTMGCAKCHDHKSDPIPQEDYYRWRAIFETHFVRTDRVPGQLDTGKDGLVRVYDTDTNTPTYLFLRGDERHPDTNRVLAAGVPRNLTGGDPSQAALDIHAVALPHAAAFPDRRPFVVDDLLAAARNEQTSAQAKLHRLQTADPLDQSALREAQLETEAAIAKVQSLVALLQVERVEDQKGKGSPAWEELATDATRAQRTQALADAQLRQFRGESQATAARRKAEQAAADRDGADREEAAFKELEKAAKEADEALAKAEKESEESAVALSKAQEAAGAEPDPNYTPRSQDVFPQTSTGRRLALAQWITDRSNPRTARVAVNHLWLRHFGRGLAASPVDFGHGSPAPLHPQLLDWLAAELMDRQWSMKALHRLIVTSRTYRMASTPDASNLQIDPDNLSLWRMPSRRMEAELIRDNLLFAAGLLDATMGGPDIDHREGLTSRRRSLYLQIASEKEVEFLKVFDGPSVTECYERHSTVMPQQALAMFNNRLAAEGAKTLAAQLEERCGPGHEPFVKEAFSLVLARPPTAEESRQAQAFLSGPETRLRERLIMVLFNHNDFVTVR